MKHVSVGDFKARFSDILREVQDGEEVAIQFGRRKETVAVLVSPERLQRGQRRQLGIMEGKASFRVKGEWKMTDEQLIAG